MKRKAADIDHDELKVENGSLNYLDVDSESTTELKKNFVNKPIGAVIKKTKSPEQQQKLNYRIPNVITNFSDSDDD